jgi:anthranilate phosphoribosyltransferase
LVHSTKWLEILLSGESLEPGEMHQLMDSMLTGEISDAQTAAILIALRAKGETGTELASAATVLRERMVRLPIRLAATLDTCGTGGDRSGTFNISTTVAIVIAACKVPVVKHGNRSVSSNSGSSDVLSELGVPVEAGVSWAQKCFESFGLGFCFAPHFHPVLAKVAPIRRQLGVRTIFNLLGPLLNPASARFQLLGVGNLAWLDPMAKALSILGTERSFLVCNREGLDEIGLDQPTHVREVVNGSIRSFEWTNEDFQLPKVSIDSVKVSNPAASAKMIEAILNNEPMAGRSIVLANAAAGLLLTGAVTSLVQGVSCAEEAIRSGLAWNVLNRLRASAGNS